MDTVIYDYLLTRVSPELFDLYLRSAALIERFDLEDNFSPILTMIETQEVLEETNILDTFHNLNLGLLRGILKDFTVEVNVDSSLLDRVELIENILTLEDHEAVDEVLSLIENLGDDPVECFLECIALVTALPAGHYLPLVEGVSYAFLQRLKEIKDQQDQALRYHQDELLETKDEQETLKQIHANLEKLLKVYPTDGPLPFGNSYALQYMVQVASYETEFSNLITLLGNDNIISDDLEMTALNLYVLAACSVDGYRFPHEYLNKVIGDYFPDIEDSRKLVEYIRQIHMKVQGSVV